MTAKTNIKTPGKLMVSGEFAVLEPYHKLVVAAVNRFVHTTIEKNESNEVSLPNYDLYHLHWNWQHKQITFPNNDVRLEFMKSAMEASFQYLQENNIELHPIQIEIKSALADGSGIKYGLGSSAAIVTSIVEGILTHYLAQPPEKITIFKLASVAHVRTQGSGSGADIAASTYGGFLQYTSFQSEWLLDQLDKVKEMTSIIHMNWIYLSINRLRFPQSVSFLVAWTGNAASTKHLVAEIKALKTTNPAVYQHFLNESREAVSLFIEGIQRDDRTTLFSGIQKNRHALKELGEAAGVPIETEELAKLSAIAADIGGGAGKLSGAGGGDCGIAFIPVGTSNELVRREWQAHGIKPLDLEIYDPDF